MNSPTAGLHTELIKASTHALVRGLSCEAIAQAMRDYADALVHPPLTQPLVHATKAGARLEGRASPVPGVLSRVGNWPGWQRAAPRNQPV